MNGDMVVASIGLACRVVIGCLDVWPSLARVLVDVGNSEPWWEDDVVDAGAESLRACIGRARGSRRVAPANDAEITVVAMTVISSHAATSAVSCIEGVPHIMVRPKSAMDRPSGALVFPRAGTGVASSLEGVPHVVVSPESAIYRPSRVA